MDTQRRCSILFHTKGLVAADVLVDANGLCRDLQSLEASAAATAGMDDLALAEIQIREDLPCMLTPSATHALKTCMTTASSLEDFRAKLLAAAGSSAASGLLDVRGIHFFRWNGEPRQHLHEVFWAMSHYASAEKHMAKTLQLLRAVSVLNDIGVKLPATMDDLVAQTQVLNEAHTEGLGWSPALPKYMELFKLQVFGKIAYCGKPSANNVYCLYVRPFLATHADRLLQEMGA